MTELIFVANKRRKFAPCQRGSASNFSSPLLSNPFLIYSDVSLFVTINYYKIRYPLQSTIAFDTYHTSKTGTSSSFILSQSRHKCCSSLVYYLIQKDRIEQHMIQTIIPFLIDDSVPSNTTLTIIHTATTAMLLTHLNYQNLIDGRSVCIGTLMVPI